jgi:hypothetical protein
MRRVPSLGDRSRAAGYRLVGAQHSAGARAPVRAPGIGEFGPIELPHEAVIRGGHREAGGRGRIIIKKSVRQLERPPSLFHGGRSGDCGFGADPRIVAKPITAGAHLHSRVPRRQRRLSWANRPTTVRNDLDDRLLCPGLKERRHGAIDSKASRFQATWHLIFVAAFFIVMPSA